MATFKRLQEQAYDYLKEKILSGEFEQGVIYSETKLAEDIEISRTPVRDALHRLSQDGFIDILPSKGFRIHKVTPHDVIETYQIRCAIEGYCALMIGREASFERAKETLKQLESLLEQQINIINTTADIEKFVDVDYSFHQLIVAYMENEGFNELFYKHMHRIRSFAIESFEEPERLNDTLQEHKNIYNAMLQGDVAHIYEITMEHMESLKNIILARIQK